ncbi:MAG: metal ABC transporter ATP-binding protein [Candidatus Andersenbacteria bacterium]|nr:metal ABC transporter ATP-binding protein [Candidatus Andersenbacteria bacterium]
MRLLPKTSGDVKIFGIPHENYKEIAPLISYIPQRLAFDDHFPLTVKGLFELKSPRPIGMSVSERTRMEEVLELVSMRTHLHERLSELSGGQLQRVLIAYSLTDHPKLLFLDEPSAGIDVQGQETIYALLDRIRQEEKLTMVLISHELEIIMQYADQVLCLNQRLLCAGAPQHVLTDDLLKEMYGTGVERYEHSHPHHD